MMFLKGKNALFWLFPVLIHRLAQTHLPGYDAKYQELIDQGVDEVYCLSVNDAFVMYQWGKHLGTSM